jgi:Holliday junction resolvase RusA-like endonuclease
MSVTRTLVLEVPSPPPKALSPNAPRGMHWSVKHRARTQWKKDWSDAITEVTVGHEAPYFPGKVSVHIVYHKGKGARSLDFDNFTTILKAGLDQLQGPVIANDNQIEGITVEQVRAADGIGRMTVIVEDEGGL